MISENIKKISAQLPNGVQIVAAGKSHSVPELLQAIDAGIFMVGENYVQEAESKISLIGNKVSWHCIGHLQKNKVKKAVELFDMIQTVDSAEIAVQINRYAGLINKVMPVLIEINSAGENQKSGVMPADARSLIAQICNLRNISIKGLMTMGPYADDPEELRPFFKLTSGIFNDLKKENLKEIDMRYLSMGMSDSYKVAVEEGANLVRIGRLLFE